MFRRSGYVPPRSNLPAVGDTATADRTDRLRVRPLPEHNPLRKSFNKYSLCEMLIFQVFLLFESRSVDQRTRATRYAQNRLGLTEEVVVSVHPCRGVVGTAGGYHSLAATFSPVRDRCPFRIAIHHRWGHRSCWPSAFPHQSIPCHANSVPGFLTRERKRRLFQGP
jgi:hypothetical protein